MATNKSVLKKLRSLGDWFFYKSMALLGYRGGLLLLWPVIFIYVLFSGKIHRTLRPYLLHRFPGQNRWQYWWHTFRCVHSFGNVIMDRAWLGIKKNQRFTAEVVGYEKLTELIAKGRGLVLLTAHVGNWQASLSHLNGLAVKVNALMRADGVASEIEDIPFDLIDAETPFGGMIEATAALQRGEVVTIMGDRYIKGSSSTVNFLGEAVRVPNSAYMLAASTGAPVAILLASKTGSMQYQVKVWGDFQPHFENRDEREQVLQEYAEKYMQLLEKYLTQYPYQWYNFYDFWKQ